MQGNGYSKGCSGVKFNPRYEATQGIVDAVHGAIVADARVGFTCSAGGLQS